MYISKYFAQDCRYGIKLKCHFTNDHDWWCHQFGHMVVTHLMSVKVRNDVTIQLQGESFSFTSYLQTYIWKSCPFRSNICPVKSDWLSQWIICACTEVILKGMSLFMEISMCLWKFGVLSQNFMKTTQSILKLWQQVFQGDGCTSPLKPVRWIEVAIFFFDHFRHIFFMIFIKFSLSVIET